MKNLLLFQYDYAFCFIGFTVVFSLLTDGNYSSTKFSKNLPSSSGFGPQIHFTPPCFNAGGPHDIAGVIFLEEVWHLMAGCWSKGGWQHLTSSDLVHWSLKSIHKFGGSGGLVMDNNGSVFAYANNLQIWKANDNTLNNWSDAEIIFSSSHGGQDPIIWYDKNNWYATISSKPYSPVNGGVLDFWTSPKLHKDGANWTNVGIPLFTNNQSVLISNHPQRKEFVTPDYFSLYFPQQNSGSVNRSVVLSSLYGPIEGGHSGTYNYAVMFPGTQTAGKPFDADLTRTCAVDWSPFIPIFSYKYHDSIGKDDGRRYRTTKGLELAYSHGGTQFGCCPKTAAGPNQRRVMFGWLQDGNSSPGTGGDPTLNTLTLPRDLSFASDGSIRQRFVPELQMLRDNKHAFHMEQLILPGGGVQNATFFPPNVSGAQLELFARFSIPISLKDNQQNNSLSSCSFGLIVLANSSQSNRDTHSSEFTVVGLNLTSQQVYIDRTMSGSPADADIRAGPWPSSSSKNEEENLSMHLYVDHNIVSMIVGNQTAITVWVHPSSSSAGRIGFFSSSFCSSTGITISTLDIWPLISPHVTKDHYTMAQNKNI